MMYRTPDSRGEDLPVGGDAAAISTPAASRWGVRAQARIRSRDPSTTSPGFLTGVQWTVPFVAFLAYIFAITTYRLPIGGFGIIVGLIGLVLQSEPRRFPWMLAWFAAFILWCAVGYVTTPYPERTWEGLTSLIKLWAIVLVAVNALRSRAQIRLFAIFFLACFALYPLRGAFENYLLYKYTTFGRAIWNHAFENPNDLAAIAILQLSMLAALLTLERRRWVRRAAQVGLVLLPLLILMTQSRAGFIALGLFALCCVTVQWRYVRKMMNAARRTQMMVIALILVVAVSFFAPSGVWQRVEGLKHLTSTQQLNQVDAEGSARQRWEIWRVASKIISEHPLFGVGVTAYPLAHVVYARGEEFDPTANGERDTHSTIMHVLAETGYPGVIFFVGLVICVVVGAERMRRKSKRIAPRSSMHMFFLEMGLLAYFTAGIFGSFAYVAFLYVHLALLWATADRTRQELAFASSAPSYQLSEPD